MCIQIIQFLWKLNAALIDVYLVVQFLEWSIYETCFYWHAHIQHKFRKENVTSVLLLLPFSDLPGEGRDPAVFPAEDLLQSGHLCQATQQPQLQHRWVREGPAPVGGATAQGEPPVQTVYDCSIPRPVNFISNPVLINIKALIVYLYEFDKSFAIWSNQWKCAVAVVQGVKMV